MCGWIVSLSHTQRLLLPNEAAAARRHQYDLVYCWEMITALNR